jgi:hypothetical protein
MKAFVLQAGSFPRQGWKVGLPVVLGAVLSLAACAPSPPAYPQYGTLNGGYYRPALYPPPSPRYPDYSQLENRVNPPPPRPVPEPPAPKQPECNNWFFSCAGASESHPRPAPPPPSPVSDDCGWWRLCSFYGRPEQ